MVPHNELNLKQKYLETNIKIKVVGHSITHTKVVKKNFMPGSFILFPGGPTSSSPIFINTTDNNNLSKNISILN